MSESNSVQSVVVTDVHMPFWSMVVFVVKWSIAAIPAVISLVTIVVLSSAAISGLSSGQLTRHEVNYGPAERPEAFTPQSTPTAAAYSQTTNFPNLAGRCKRSPEPEQCMELEGRLAAETPEQRWQRFSNPASARPRNPTNRWHFSQPGTYTRTPQS